MSFFYKKGMTVIEILVVVVVLGIIFLIVIPQFSKMRENQALKNAVGEIISSLNKAQSQTLASVDSSSYGVHFQPDKVIIFKGAIFSVGDANNETIDIILPAIILTSGNVYFNRLTGSSAGINSISVGIPDGPQKTISISATGVASVN
ncbi:MAG: hypothetical protein UU13_C0010G0005 [Candidatus Nomurabacteria bacterium GW2011_GWB1_40_7]|uniref:Prepilin-type N-terminal cleavage/methylation domain-containing protein n=1 Tax=Candidatus Nomurabacteria bacterium GW2011_GWB1_40_7 TaxID=1618744 RepID=A0A0G0VDX9_9BACT|nr:MAG: hypothetical protein UU13_C0010G0005 [Candidatus Nomurabacteria bacterium GW2011_GWB1_40_7]